VLLFEDALIEQQGLTVPHPHMHERLFVLLPLCDLNPTGIHPKMNLSFEDLASIHKGDNLPRSISGFDLL